MTVLAFDTATAMCSAAVRRGAAVCDRRLAMDRGHAEALLPLIQAVLADSGVGFAAIDLLAVTVGPGAFTGLRIGLAAARGLALATARPCAGFTTLEVLAAEAAVAAGGIVLAVLDSKRGDVYAQPFAARGAGLAEALQPPQVLPVAGLAALLPAAGPAPVVAGDVAEAAAAALARAGIAAHVSPVRHPSAAVLAALAWRSWQRGERPAGPPRPLYLRAPATGRPCAESAAGGGVPAARR